METGEQWVTDEDIVEPTDVQDEIEDLRVRARAALEAGDFLLEWRPGREAGSTLRRVLSASAKAQPKLLQTRFRAIKNADMRNAIVDLAVGECQVQLDELGLRDATSIDEMNGIVDAMAETIPYDLIRLAVLRHADECENSARVIELVCSNDELRLPGFPPADALDDEPARELWAVAKTAHVAAAELARAAEAGVLPEPTDLAAVSAYVEALNGAIRELGDVQDDSSPTLRSIDEVSAERARRRRAEQRPFVSLAQLSRLEAEVEDPAIDGVIQLATELGELSHSELDDARRAQGEALAALLTLLAEHPPPPAGELVRRVRDVRSGLPEHLVGIGDLVMGGYVQLREDASQFSRPHDEPQDGNDQASLEVVPADVEVGTSAETNPETHVDQLQDGARVDEGTQVTQQDLDVIEDDVEDEMDAVTSEDMSRGTLGDAIAGQHLGPAYWWAQAHEYSAELAHAIELLALSLRIAAPTDGIALHADDLALSVDPIDFRDQHDAFALALLAHVVGGVKTGLPGFSTRLHQLAKPDARLPNAVQDLVAAVAPTPEGGIDMAVRHRAGGEENAPDVAQELTATAERAAALVRDAPHRRIKYQPATVVWQELTSENGRLGELLRIVASDDRSKVTSVRAGLNSLTARKAIDDLIQQTVSSTTRLKRVVSIEARALQTLIGNINEVVDLLQTWSDLVAQNSRRQSRGDDFDVEQRIRELETDIRPAFKELVDGLTDLDEPIVECARGVERHVRGLLDGDQVPSPCAVEDVLIWELSSEPLVPSDDDRSVDVTGLTAAAMASIQDGVTEAKLQAVLERGDFERVEAVLRVLGPEHPVHAPMQERFEIALKELEARIADERQLAESLLGQARNVGLLDDAEASVVLVELEPSRVHEHADQLLHARQVDDVVARLRERLDRGIADRRSLIDRHVEAGDLDAPRLDSLETALGAYDLRTVDELLSHLAGGASIGARDALDHVTNFFPDRVVASQRVQPGPELLEVIATGGAVGPYDFSELSDDERTESKRAVRSWIEITSRPRELEPLRDGLPSIFRMIGLEIDVPVRGSGAPEGRNRLWLDARGIQRFGRAMVPQLGSQMAGDGLRVLVLFQDFSAEKILEFLDADSSGSQAIVVYSGVFAPDQRRALAGLCRKKGRLVPLVDWSLLLEMATRRDEARYEVMVHLVVPFTWVNPYTPLNAGRVPREMFYGRRHEVDRVLDKNGPTFVYGGRQLGKSALLRRVEVELRDREGEARAVYLDLNFHGVGVFQPPARLWSALADELTSIGLDVQAKKVPFETVRHAVLNWLEGDERRRLVMLIDECDAMLEADHLDNYRETQRIRGLMDETDRRCKFVLAGLNVVQRFERGVNHPMAHVAGGSISVGPLEPRDAFNLVSEPFNALGIRFEDGDALVYKILAETNDQASIIQLVCHRLVERVRRQPVPVGGGLSTLTRRDIDEELQNAELREEIRRRFEWTISLDPRYEAIAYRLALETVGGAPRHGTEALRALCCDDWQVAFADSRAEEFRWYLTELETLGVIRSEDDHWLLRSPNVVELLGSDDAIFDRLVHVTQGEITPRLDPVSLRFPIDEVGTPGPVTGDQVDRLLAGDPPIVVMVATELAGRDGVVPTVQRLQRDRDLKLSIRRPKQPSEMPHRLSPDSALEGGRSVLTVADLTGLETAAGSRLASLAAQEVMAGTADNQFHLVIARPEQIGADLPRDVLVCLRKWGRTDLRRWFESRNIAVTSDDIEKLRSVTGGWHQLLAPVLAAADPLKAMGSLVAEAPVPELASEDIVELSAIGVVPGAMDFVRLVVELGPAHPQDLAAVSDQTFSDAFVEDMVRFGFVGQTEDGVVADPILAMALNQHG